MDFQPSERARQTAQSVRNFIQTHIEPVEKEHWAGILGARHGGDWTQWKIPARVEELKAKAKAEGKTLFFSSHILSDIDEICDRICIIHDSKLVYLGTAAEFKPTFQEQSLERAFLKAIGETNISTRSAA